MKVRQSKNDPAERARRLAHQVATDHVPVMMRHGDPLKPQRFHVAVCSAGNAEIYKQVAQSVFEESLQGTPYALLELKIKRNEMALFMVGRTVNAVVGLKPENAAIAREASGRS